VLFGGFAGRDWQLNDTWLWDGKTWIIAEGKGPPAMGGANIAFDPSSGSLILLGGRTHEYLTDTWAWDGKSWRAFSPHGFPPYGCSLAYSAAVGKLISSGGTRSKDPNEPGSQETWAWDGMNWSEVSFGPAPPERLYAAMAADPSGKVILLFGGVGGFSSRGRAVFEATRGRLPVHGHKILNRQHRQHVRARLWSLTPLEIHSY
jgi:hypothetical protein